MGYTCQWIQQGRKLHLQEGPIDLIIVIEGDGNCCRFFDAACEAFEGLLSHLAMQLPTLRTEISSTTLLPDQQLFSGPVARRMRRACLPFAGLSITPMAAVAGSVADEILAVIVRLDSAAEIRRAWVNNGGDIALFLAPQEEFKVQLVANPQQHLANLQAKQHTQLSTNKSLMSDTPACFSSGNFTSEESLPIEACATLQAATGIGGVATSGRHGRSFSLGIADAVTVLAANAAVADVAATLIANAVDLPGNPGIERCPACEIDIDSDLQTRLVVTDVAQLDDQACAQALRNGLQVAGDFIRQGLIREACLTLQSRSVQANEHNTRRSFSDDNARPPFVSQYLRTVSERT